MSQSILITGGAGYIGSHVAHALHKAGFAPIVLDNLSRGRKFAAKRWTLVQGDIADADLIKKTCHEHKPIALMHFAALTEVAESVREPEKYFENNHGRTEQLLKAARAGGIKHTVFSSTAAVYGMPASNDPILESAELKPINPYGASKVRAEGALAASGMRFAILRYFNACGALAEENIGEGHWPETHLVPRAILAALRKVPPLELFGTDYPTPDGTAIRDYVHVMDLADAHLKALYHLLGGNEKLVCNLGSGKGSSVKEVLDTIERVLGQNVPHKVAPRRAGDPAYLVADSSYAQKTLSWRPRFNLQDMVASAARWHQSALYQTEVLGK